MSSFLIDEHPLVVQPTLAKLVGINQAIIIQQIQYWASKGKNIRDGHAWVYNTYESWQKQFPWMSARTIQREVLDAERRGYLVSDTSGFDRTKWYRVDREKIAADIAAMEPEADAPSRQSGTIEDANLTPSKTPKQDAVYTETNQRLTRGEDAPAKAPAHKASPEARSLAHAWYKALNLSKPPANVPRFYADMQKLADAGITPDELTGEIAWLQKWAKDGISIRLILARIDEYRTIAPQDDDRYLTIGGITYLWGQQ